MIAWQAYNPIALHRTYERLTRQQQTLVTPEQLSGLTFDGLFDALRDSEIAPLGAADCRAAAHLGGAAKRQRDRATLLAAAAARCLSGTAAGRLRPRRGGLSVASWGGLLRSVAGATRMGMCDICSKQQI